METVENEVSYAALSEATRKLYPFKGNVIRVGGHRYHYLDEGESQAKDEAILMVHGNPTWSFYYRDMVKALRNTHRVIAPDHIGCGFSDKPRDADYHYSLAQRVDDLAALVDYLGLKNITLMVHDWGGMIGMAFATKYPQKIRKIIVSNTAAFHLPKKKSMPLALKICRDTALGSVLVRGLNMFSLAAIHKCVRKKPMAKAVKDGYLAPYSNWNERRAVLRFVQDIPLSSQDPAYLVVSSVENALPVLSKIPTLIVWGSDDFVFDDHFLNDWRENFPTAEIHYLEGVGHYVLEDAFEQVLPLVQNFLDKPSLSENLQ